MPEVVAEAHYGHGAVDDDKDGYYLHNNISRAAAQMTLKPVIAAEHIGQAEIKLNHDHADNYKNQTN